MQHSKTHFIMKNKIGKKNIMYNSSGEYPITNDCLSLSKMLTKRAVCI